MDLLSRLGRKIWAKSRKGVESSRPPQPHGFPFFRLPRELRDMIYTELLTRPQISEIWLTYEFELRGWVDVTAGRRFPRRRGSNWEALPISLLLVNRAMYKEASRILYGRNTIVLGGTTDNIVNFFLTMTPWTRSVIRSLRLWIELYVMIPCHLSIRPNPRDRLKQQTKRKPPHKRTWWTLWLSRELHYPSYRRGLEKLLNAWENNLDTSGKVYRKFIGNDTYHCGPVRCCADNNDECLEWSRKSLHRADQPQRPFCVDPKETHDAGWGLIRQFRFLLQELDFREESIAIHPTNCGLDFGFDFPYAFMAVRGKNFRAI